MPRYCIISHNPWVMQRVGAHKLPAAAVQVTLVGAGDDLETVAASIRVSSIYELLVGLIGAQSMLALLIARSEGRRLSLGSALNEGAQNWARAVGARFRSGLNILGFALLLILPGFWKATLLMFSSIAVLRSQERDALEASEKLVKGRLGLCFGFALAAVVVCYGPMIVIGAAVGLACEALSFPRFPLELATDLVDRLGTDVAMTSVLYSGYVMLHRTARLELAPMRWRRRPELLSKR